MGLCCRSNKNNSGAFVAIFAGAVVATGAINSKDSDASSSDAPTAPTPTAPAPYVLGHDAERIDGTPQPLEAFKGDVILIVNTASKCGLTPQYEGLEALYREKKGEGFTILGFPANNFMGQEPGTNEQIAHFCAERYDVTFPMFAKIDVKGSDTHPLYEHLAGLSEEPSWNFTKYLVDRKGNFVHRFGPRTAPQDETLRSTIDELLEAPTPETEESE